MNISDFRERLDAILLALSSVHDDLSALRHGPSLDEQYKLDRSNVYPYMLEDIETSLETVVEHANAIRKGATT